jgi:3-hydroxybutyryl-CoA dehydrogenase
MLYVRKVGVVGAGAMGAQIAQIMAMNGYEVYLKDVSKALVERGMDRIRKDLASLVSFQETKAAREISRVEEQDGIKLTEDQKTTVAKRLKPTFDASRADEALSKIHVEESLSGLKESDLVIEAVIEVIEEKQKLVKDLDGVLSKHAIVASNTSTLSITEIASASKAKRDKIIGTHFFNPPITLPLVEVVPGLETSEETTNDVIDFLSSIRNHRYPMMPIRVKEVPGFLVNRILGAMLNESYALYEQGVAAIRDIDQAMKAGAGFPMGPFELSDLIGLDVLYHVEENMKRMEGSFLTPRPTQIVKKLYNSGRLGRKTGRGFYEYTVE